MFLCLVVPKNHRDENTPKDDPRLVELDVLSALVEEYEKAIVLAV